jgi:ABC-type branched-subunit amino acid transport system substrate-binding protein
MKAWSALVLAALFTFPAHAQKVYGPGVSDTEIKLGQSTPLSGPASAFGAGAGRSVVGYFDWLNEQGGINGRKISFTQLDNAYSAPKAVEQSRKLVEDIGVLAEVGTIGTVPNVAIQKYLNSKQVPQLFITAGGRRFNDPKNFPWTVPLYPDFETEGRVIAKYILKTKPEAKIGVLYQNDDYGKDYVKGLRAGLGDKASQIVLQVSYELADPTIDSQIVQLKAAGIDTLIEQSAAKAAARLAPAAHHRRVDGIGRDRAETGGP